MSQECILSLDLGTSAFKAAPAHCQGEWGSPTIIQYELDFANGAVTCPPERYLRALINALRGAVETARSYDLTVRAIGICSQAQTFLAMDAHGEPLAPAIVWTDSQALTEADEAAAALPDFARSSGFARPSPLQFLPKVMRLRHQGMIAQRFLLLNEWVIAYLTGEAYGDETNQGMGGFFDIERRTWSEPALTLAEITPEQLAHVAPAASYWARLKPEIAHMLGVAEVPVYSCGNDQSAAAIGAGLERTGDILCNFGTAMVVYALRNYPVMPKTEAQIAGLSPFASEQKSGYFLLGSESEFGNTLDWLSLFLYPGRGLTKLIEVLERNFPCDDLPQITRIRGGRLDLCGLSVGSTPEHLVCAVWEFYAARFAELLHGVRDPDDSSCRLFASGGMSNSEEWMNFLSERSGLQFVRTPSKYPAMTGIARIIAQNRTL